MVLVPQHQSKLVADTEMTIQTTAMLVIYTDSLQLRLLLEQHQKLLWFFCLEMGVSRRGTVGGEVDMPLQLTRHTKSTLPWFCQPLHNLSNVGYIKKLLY